MSKRPNVLINISMQELAMARICPTEENKSPIIVQFGPFRRGHLGGAIDLKKQK